MIAHKNYLLVVLLLGLLAGHLIAGPKGSLIVLPGGGIYWGDGGLRDQSLIADIDLYQARINSRGPMGIVVVGFHGPNPDAVKAVVNMIKKSPSSYRAIIVIACADQTNSSAKDIASGLASEFSKYRRKPPVPMVIGAESLTVYRNRKGIKPGELGGSGGEINGRPTRKIRVRRDDLKIYAYDTDSPLRGGGGRTRVTSYEYLEKQNPFLKDILDEAVDNETQFAYQFTDKDENYKFGEELDDRRKQWGFDRLTDRGRIFARQVGLPLVVGAVSSYTPADEWASDVLQAGDAPPVIEAAGAGLGAITVDFLGESLIAKRLVPPTPGGAFVAAFGAVRNWELRRAEEATKGIELIAAYERGEIENPFCGCEAIQADDNNWFEDKWESLMIHFFGYPALEEEPLGSGTMDDDPYTIYPWDS